jgi:hypothetical protein
MKYLLKAIYYTFLFLLFIIGCTAQFLWGLNRPTLSLQKTFDEGEEFLENIGTDNDDY